MPSAAVVAFWLDSTDWNVGRLLLVVNRYNTAPFITCNITRASLAERLTQAQLSFTNRNKAQINESETKAELS
jgi:hypothetical protein